jgi:hypothetical protein
MDLPIMMPPFTAYVAAGIDQIDQHKSASKTLKQLTLGRTTFMDAPFFMDKKQEETSRREKETVLRTEAILLRSKLSSEGFPAGANESDGHNAILGIAVTVSRLGF